MTATSFILAHFLPIWESFWTQYCLYKSVDRNKNSSSSNQSNTPYELYQIDQKIRLLIIYDPYSFCSFNLFHWEKYWKALHKQSTLSMSSLGMALVVRSYGLLYCWETWGVEFFFLTQSWQKIAFYFQRYWVQIDQ